MPIRLGTALIAALGMLLGPLAIAASAAAAPHATPPVVEGSYVSVTPFRIVDTRTGATDPATYAGQTLAAAATLNVQVTGVGTVPVPATASTAVLNVTVTNPTDASFLTVFPEGETPMPTVSNLNFSSGETVANLVTVPLSATGGVSIYNSAGSTDVVADVEGYYTSTPSTNGSGLYNAISPVRALGALSFGAPVAANTSVPVTVTGTLTGVPATATAVVANVTAEGATLPSFLTVYPAGATMPVASNLNFPAQAKNVAIANRVKIGIGTNGQIEVYNHSGTVNVDVDVDGYYTGAGGTGSYFVPITPVRLADTRTTSLVGTETPIAASTSESFLLATTASGIPATATAVEANFTVVPGDANGYLTVYPGTSTTTVPVASDVNWVATNLVPRSAQGIPNFDIADTAGTGSVEVYNSHGATINLVIDAFGYFMTSTAPTTAFTVTPTTPTTTTTGTDVTYTVTGLTAANCPTGLADLALFPAVGADAPTTSGIFSPTTGAGHVPQNGTALGQDMTTGVEQGHTLLGTFLSGAGYIDTVNGVSTAGPGTYTVAAIAAAAGTFSFQVNSSVADSTIPVVFCEPSIASVLDSLQVLASGIPENGYPVGVGGATTWQPPAAPAGNYFGWTVESDPAGNFVACAGPGSTPPGPVTDCYTFNYLFPGDTFSYWSPNGALISIPLSESQFAADLSGAWTASPNDYWYSVPGDSLYQISYNPTGVSSFSYPFTDGNDYPAAPTGVTATVNAAGTVTLTLTGVPNQNVSSDTTTILNPNSRAQYLFFRQTEISGVGTGWSCIGSTLPGGDPTSPYGVCAEGGNQLSASPPPTSFTDTTVESGVTYVYAAEALTNYVNSDGQLWGPPSATTAAVTPTAAAAAATQPLSINAVSAPPTGFLASGNALTVDFNQAVTLASTWSLTVTDGAGNEAEVDNGTGVSPTLGDATATVVTGPDGVNSAITYTLTSAPTMVYGIATSLNLAHMEILGQSGVSTTGGAWNIIGSGPAVGNDSNVAVVNLSRRFNGASGDQNQIAPFIGTSPDAISENAPNSVVVACNVPGSMVTVYNAAGASIGTESACTGGDDTIGTSTFASGASLYVTETPAVAGSYESLATFIGPVVTFVPSSTDAIAPAGTLGDNQGVTVTATVTTLLSPDPNFSLGLSFTSTAAYPGTANVAGTALVPTSQSFTTNASGQVAIHYTSSGSSTTQVTGEDMIHSAITVVPVNGPDVYSYAPSVQIAFTSGPGVPTSGSTTAVEQPTWTGTASSPPLTTITGVMCEINGTTATAGTINTGGGTDSVTWSWTAPSLVGDGLSSVSCTATDSSSVTGTVDTTFDETGNPLLITSVATGLTAPWSTISGPADGGNTVTITGTGFGYATGVFFGGFAATSFIVVSNTEITAVAPGGTAGAADVTVTNETLVASNAEPYSYVGPLATAVVFANHGVSGTMDPGDTITITYDEAMDPASMGAALNVAGNTLTAGGGTTTPVSLNAILGATGTLGSFAVAATGTDTVNAALSANGETLTLTFVAVNGAALSGNFTPAVGVTDLFANAELATAVVPSGAF